MQLTDSRQRLCSDFAAADAREFAADRVLIYRLGSMGDFVVALPALHLVRRRFPNATIGLLTNHPVDNVAAPAQVILHGTGLIDDYFTYSIPDKPGTKMRSLAKLVRDFAPKLVIYLGERPSFFGVLRDGAFFKTMARCPIVGLPLARDKRFARFLPSSNRLFESEASRLGRCIAMLGQAHVENPAAWDLHLSTAEQKCAAQLIEEGLKNAPPNMRLIAFSIGTKQPQKQWGVKNWRSCLEPLNRPEIGVLLIGAEMDRSPSLAALHGWTGPVIDLCGRVPPRVSAAALSHAELLCCNDSGPMHLAAAVGTRCAAVFSPMSPPGVWFPFGDRHRVFYPYGGTSIDDIRPRDVCRGIMDVLGVAPDGGPR